MAVNEIFHIGRGVTYLKNHANKSKSTAFITRRSPDNVNIKTGNDLASFVDRNPRDSFRDIPIHTSEGRMRGNGNAVAMDTYKDVGQVDKMAVASGHMDVKWISDRNVRGNSDGSTLMSTAHTSRNLGFSIMKFPFRTHKSMDAWDHKFGMINDAPVKILTPMGIVSFSTGQLWARMPEFKMFEDGTAEVYEGYFVFWGLQGSWWMDGRYEPQQFREQNGYAGQDKKLFIAWQYLAGTMRFPMRMRSDDFGTVPHPVGMPFFVSPPTLTASKP